jgi:hypothetical protein
MGGFGEPGAMERFHQSRLEGIRLHGARVDMHAHQGFGLTVGIGGLGGLDGIAEVLFVLDPIEFDLQASKLVLVDRAFRQQRIEGRDDFLRRGSGGFPLQMVEFDDH